MQIVIAFLFRTFTMSLLFHSSEIIAVFLPRQAGLVPLVSFLLEYVMYKDIPGGIAWFLP